MLGGLIGGYCIGIYSYDSFSEEMLAVIDIPCFPRKSMMRLFFMSLCVLIISGIFFRNRKEIPVSVYVISNIIAAILFAAGHIPSTMTMTSLTPEILIRCFLFNGGFGLQAPELYKKQLNITKDIRKCSLCLLDISFFTDKIRTMRC